MGKFGSNTIIFLLVIGLLTSIVSAKSASVLLREGLYAEEIQGDLEAAIKIYEQITAEKSKDRRCTAEAMYRLGVCYMKKQDQHKAKAVLEKLVDEFGEQEAIINKARPLLDEMSSIDPAALMPPETKIYLEFGSPGKQIETILSMLKGTAFENPLAAMGGDAAGDANVPRQRTSADVLAALMNPSMMAEFKKLRGMAIGITGIQSNNPPLVAVLDLGKSDALRGIVLAALGMQGQPGESIEGMQAILVGSEGGIAYDDRVIIIAQPMEQLKWSVKQYKGLTDEATLISRNKSFGKLGRKKRQDNALTIWLDGAALFPAFTRQFNRVGGMEVSVIDAFSDLSSIEEVIAYLSIDQKDIVAQASVDFEDGHHCLVYDLFRTPNLSSKGFEAVPAGAVALVSFALSEPESYSSTSAQKAVRKLTGLDIGREIFANIEQISLFALPPGPVGSESILAKKISPVLSCCGLVLTSHNPQQTYQLLDRVLKSTELMTNANINEQPANQANTSGSRYQVGFVDGKPIYCYMGQAGNNTILALSQQVLDASVSALKNRESALRSGALQRPLGKLSPRVSKLAVVNIGGAIRITDAHIHRLLGPGRDPNKYPLSQVLGQLARACDDSSIQLCTAESINSFNLNVSISELPPMGEVIPLLARLPESMPENLTPSAIKPRPANGGVVSPAVGPELRWTAGINATAHKVYFGRKAEQLSLLAEVNEPGYGKLPRLEKEGTYYWRVDEVLPDGSTVAGKLWSFGTGGLIGWWRFDEVSGNTAADSSVGASEAVLYNGPGWQPSDGVTGGALKFDGVDDYVRTSDNAEKLQLGGDYTLAVWIKADPSQNIWSGVLSKCSTDGSLNHCTLQFDGSGRGLIVHYLIESWDTGVTLSDVAGKWHHISIVRSGNTMTSYLDGNEVSRGTWGCWPGSGAGHLNIGAERTSLPICVYRGLIDDVRIYNYALTAEEVAKLYKAEQPKSEAEPEDK